MNNIAPSEEVPSAFQLQVNTSSRSTNDRRENVSFTVVDGGTDGGVSFYEPHGYWVNMSLASLRGMVSWLSAHLRQRQERFRPIGWRLVPLDSGKDPIDVRDGQSVTFVGDAFVIRGQDGATIGPAYSALDYSIEPIVS